MLATTALASSTSPAETMALAKSCWASKAASGEFSSFSLCSFMMIGCLSEQSGTIRSMFNAVTLQAMTIILGIDFQLRLKHLVTLLLRNGLELRANEMASSAHLFDGNHTRMRLQFLRYFHFGCFSRQRG